MRTLSLALAFALAALPASGVQLRFDPQGPLVQPGGQGHLSVMLDEVLDLRTVELTVSYDEGVLGSLSGEPGQLFDDTGCFVWDDLEEPGSGLWHGFAVIMDAYCWATGPGELYRWNFQGLQLGYTRIHVEDVRLFDVDGDPIPDVELADTWVFVADEITSIPEGGLEPRSWTSLKSMY